MTNEKLRSGVGVLHDSHSILAPSFVSLIETAALLPTNTGARPTPITFLVKSEPSSAKEEMSANVPPLYTMGPIMVASLFFVLLRSTLCAREISASGTLSSIECVNNATSVAFNNLFRTGFCFYILHITKE